MFFNKTRLSVAAIATVFSVATSTANAQLNFDNVTTNAAGFNTTAFTTYGGYSFENFGVLTNGSSFGAGNNASSPTKFAYAQADGSSFIYRTDATFNFASAYLSFRQFDQNLAPISVIVRGYRPGDFSASFEQSVELTNTAQLFSFQFTDIEELEFETGFLQAGGRSAVLALDDASIAVVPEPSTVALMATGLVAILVAGRKRSRRSA
ncbi:MAG: PEP-CTERM sorting domain-containing protein [Gemmatimonas sp.]